jgi:hypothetical protein
MTDLENERHRGARAQSIMTDPIMIESFQVLKGNYFNAWADSMPTDKKQRQRKSQKKRSKRPNQKRPSTE